MSPLIALTSWFPLLADLPTDPAQRAGYIIGVIIGILIILSIFAFGILSIIMAFLKRTTGWIIAGCISGLIVGAFAILMMRGFIAGFKQGYENARQRAGSKSTSTEIVTGKVIPFTIEMPAGWILKRGVGSYDMVMNDSKGYIGVIAEKANVGSSESLAQFARLHFQSMGTDVSLGENKNVEIDGRTWIAFTARAKLKNLPFAYQCYVYAGKEGSFQMMGWSFEGDWEEVSPHLDRILHTVHLPAPGAAATPP